MWPICAQVDGGRFRAPVSDPHATSIRHYSALTRLEAVPPPVCHQRRHRSKIKWMSGNCSLLLAVRRDITCCSVQETASSSGSSDSLISEDEIEARLRKAVNFMKTSDKLVPYDPASTNLGLVIWQAIRAIPEQHRHRLVKELSSG